MDNFIKSLGQIPMNAVKDVGNIVSGIGQLPGQIDTAIQSPQNALNFGKNMVGGFANEMNQFMGDPVKNVPLVGIQTPEQNMNQAGATYQHAQQHPVNTALDALTLLNSAKAFNTDGNPAPSQPSQPATQQPMQPSQPASPDIPDEAVAKYNSVFQVPRNVAQNMNIKPDMVIKQLINDGVTNVDSLDDLGKVADSITGDQGAFPRINRIILSDIKDPVDITAARDAAGINQDVASSLDKYLKGSPEGLVNTVKGQVERAMPSYNMTDNMPQTGALPSDIFDSTQELDKLAKMYTRKAYTVMGDLNNPEYERAGQAVSEISNNLKDSLDNAITPEQYQTFKTDPRVMTELQRVPVKVAQNWLDNATQFRDGRSIQAPYVALKNMVEDTKDSQLSAFTKWIGQMQKTQGAPSASVAQGITHPIQAAQAAGQSGLQKVLSPLVDKSSADLFNEATSGVAGSSGQTSALPAIAKTVGSTLPPVLSSLSQSPNNQAPQQGNAGGQNEPANINQGNDNQNINGNNHSGIISSQGRYSMVSPFDEGLAQPLEGLKSKIQQIQARLPDEQLNNPQAAAADSGALAKLQTDLSTQAPLSNKWTQTNTVMGVANAASDMLSKAPPQFWQQFKTLEQLRAANDPQYARLINALDYLDKNVPGSNLFTAKNLEGALGSLDQVVQNAQTEYQGVKSQFVGGNTLNPVGNQQMSLPPMAQIQSPPTGQIGQPVHYGFNFGSAGQNLPPIQ